jgi:hypothetical protein
LGHCFGPLWIIYSGEKSPLPTIGSHSKITKKRKFSITP